MPTPFHVMPSLASSSRPARWASGSKSSAAGLPPSPDRNATSMVVSPVTDVRVQRSATEVTVVVEADPLEVVPGFPLKIRAELSAPVEEVTP